VRVYPQVQVDLETLAEVISLYECCVNVSGEKLKLVTVLIHQLLTTTVARNWIDDCAKKLVSAQRHLKCHQLAEQRRSRDETHFWFVSIVISCFILISICEYNAYYYYYYITSINLTLICFFIMLKISETTCHG